MSDIGVVSAKDEQRESAAVIAENLVKHFTSGPVVVKAVDGVTLTLPRGKMIALRGPSGCGKSTLLNLIGALDKPTSGQIAVDGVQLGSLSGRAEAAYRRTKAGFVFQSFNLIPQLSAVENVMLPMEFTDRPKTEREERARTLLKQVGIDDDRQNHCPNKLSGGQQQRVAIARAVANDPPVVLADEPTANLDSKTGRRIVDLLRQLSRDGRTVVVATHDIAIASHADVVVEMSDGQVVSIASPRRR